MRRICLTLAALAAALAAQAPWVGQVSGTHASLRGLSAVSAHVVWASGSQGTVLRTTDGGAHWTRLPIPAAGTLDFRDIQAFSADLAYALAVGINGGIYKTSDGGASWTKQYGNVTRAAAFFLDDLAFWDKNHGLALGDPMNGHFLVLRTSDGGAHWRPVADTPPALAGEGAFAASGTTLITGPHGVAWFASGGRAGARLFASRDQGRTWTVAATPLSAPGWSGAGIFSLALDRKGTGGIAVGGDYTRPDDRDHAAAITADGGVTWQLAATPPGGYRSAVAFVPGSHGRTAIAVGPTGSDISLDGGATWSPLGQQGFNAVAFASGAAGWAVGEKGAIARYLPSAAASQTTQRRQLGQTHRRGQS
jgi:photosystem II stability/assembly factor-like uncharacterized protein